MKPRLLKATLGVQAMRVVSEMAKLRGLAVVREGRDEARIVVVPRVRTGTKWRP